MGDEESIERLADQVIKNHGKKRPLFERMWVFRDFTKHAGMSVDKWLGIKHITRDHRKEFLF